MRLHARNGSATVPAAFGQFAEYEAEATRLRLFEHSVFPGLFQTEGYARAVLSRHPAVTGELVSERVAHRMQRQAILTRAMVWAVLDESVLHREIGDAETMYGQLYRVCEVATLPNVTVQLVPATGYNVGLLGAFVMADTPNHGCIVHVETIADGQIAEDPITVTQVDLRFDHLRTEAYRGSESLALLQEAAETWKRRTGESPATAAATEGSA